MNVGHTGSNTDADIYHIISSDFVAGWKGMEATVSGMLYLD